MKLPANVFAVLMAMVLVGCSRTPAPPPANTHPETATLPPGDPVEGKRLATLVGCNGCHGKDGAGELFHEEKGAYRLVAPNLTQRRALYDDAALKALLREGRTHDGHRPLGMPILMFQHLSDAEIRDITAWLRSIPAVSGPALPESWLSEKTKQLVAKGGPPYDDDRPDLGNRPPSMRPTEPLALGRHLAMTVCSECHGRTLDSRPGDDTPPLVVAKAYTADKFTRLMATGITAAGKESRSGLMTMVARTRFSHLTAEEVTALKLYLDSR
ncbi:MAG TPA: cytochrome c [Xanthomonadaceae bacterium]|nr:cytochrome c [Xanthomonadaceae bacterium]